MKRTEEEYQKREAWILFMESREVALYDMPWDKIPTHVIEALYHKFIELDKV